MPATESTWRDMPLMHRIFAISGVVLTLSTVWMFYKDHVRPWKAIQPTTVNIDLKMNQWRQEQFETSEALYRHEKLSQSITTAMAQALDDALLAKFKDELARDATYRETSISTASLDARAQDLQALAPEAARLRAAANEALAVAEKKPEDSALAEAARKAEEAALTAEKKAGKVRATLVAELQGLVDAAKIREDKVLGDRKFKSARIDAARANLDIAIRDNLGEAELARRQKIVDDLLQDKGGFNDLNQRYQTLSAHRKELDRLLKLMTTESAAAQKSYDDSIADLDRLKTQYGQQRENYFDLAWGFVPVPGKKILTLPILDAFGSPRKIETQWSDGLLQDFNHARVRRFDRCTTCHQSIQKTLPGQPTTPAYSGEQILEMVLIPPPKGTLPKTRLDAEGKAVEPELVDWLGLRLAEEGLLAHDDVTVSLVLPKTPAARAQLVDPDAADQPVPGLELRQAVARLTSTPGSSQNPFPLIPGLMIGDVITGISGDTLFGGDRGPRRVEAMLIALAQDGKPIHISVRRGLPNPYTSHPRLDLFVGDSSPHPMQKFACTICHDGQGSATEFKWASHTPNTPLEAARWGSEYGWFDNVHWLYPMYPTRFAEASCIKCHHEVVELERSERFPAGPAPKIVHGYHLIRKYGCYGCHEVNGYDGPIRRIGPDMRAEPSFFAVAQQLEAEIVQRRVQFAALKPAGDDAAALGTLGSRLDQMDSLASQLASHPENDTARHDLKTMIEEDSASQPTKFGTALAPQSHRLANLLKDVEAPGDLRKPGPSLRYVGAKLDRQFLYDWLLDPTKFRPNTRMPKFFGLWNHLKKDGEMHDPKAPLLEPIEIRGMIEYLLAYSQDQLVPASTAPAAGAPSLEKLAEVYQPLTRPEGIDEWTEDEKLARGKEQFQTRGCLACHTHKDFPDVAKYRPAEEIVQGPDLSAVGNKFGKDRNPDGPDWLYSWIKEPTRYHARTVMPNLFLTPEVKPGTDPAKPTEGAKMFDPADDIATWLLATSTSDWKPVTASANAAKPLDSAGQDALKQLTLEYLNEAFYKDAASDYYVKGIPPELEAELKGAEKDLIVLPGQQLTDLTRLKYIGRKSIAKYGCFGCHDIPGFEDAKPIGTGLADWGRKDPAKLAFEHITHYIEHGHGHAGHGEHAGHGHESPPPAESDAVTPEKETADYFRGQLEAGSRIGFIYQKLAEPRSYDFDKTENKRYNERLRMPQFPFSVEEREAVVTFVLGLVADPPREKFVFTPGPRAAAIVAGKQVLEKYNCGGCHMLEVEKWNLTYAPGDFGPQKPENIFPFLLPHFSPKDLAAEGTPDHRNELHSTLRGLPKLKKEDGYPELTDLEGLAVTDADAYKPSELRLPLDLTSPTIIDGQPYVTGGSPVFAGTGQLAARYPSWGGALTRYLLPEVTKLERAVNSNGSGAEAYAWLPPPLIGEGSKVQSAWLHDFLLEPYPIRPAVFLRMPKFNMSSAEATALVNYFSAVDNAEYPYDFNAQRLESELVARARAYGRKLDEAGAAGEGGKWADKPDDVLVAKRFNDAMNIVVNRSFCVTCHKVADFAPAGRDRAKAPNLAEVYRRLRPEYTRNWIARPKMILPYTSMPNNIEYDPADPNLGKKVAQDIFHGTSIEQLDGVVDLLMNFDQYTRQGRNVTKLVPPLPPAGAEGTTPPPATSGGQ